MLHTFGYSIILSFTLTWCPFFSTAIGKRHFWGKLLPYVPLKKKNAGVWMGPFKKRAVFHLELVVILAMWFFYHQGALEALTLTHGINAWCGDDQVLWRCLDTIKAQIRAHLSHIHPPPPTHAHTQLAHSHYKPFMMLCSSKENWLKAFALNYFLF